MRKNNKNFNDEVTFWLDKVIDAVRSGVLVIPDDITDCKQSPILINYVWKRVSDCPSFKQLQRVRVNPLLF